MKIRLKTKNFPLKQMIFNWNSLSLELKATADPTEFDQLLKQKFISQYSYETDCQDNCYSCNIWVVFGVHLFSRHIKLSKAIGISPLLYWQIKIITLIWLIVNIIWSKGKFILFLLCHVRSLVHFLVVILSFLLLYL